MNILELKHFFLTELDGCYPKKEIISFFHLLIQHKLQLTKIEVALHPTKALDAKTISFFKNAISELKAEKPIQYIIGSTEFYGLNFCVNENVLIPRPETEELVDWIIKDSQNTTLNILDIGTGSGCIGISLAKNLSNAKVYAVDISKKALEIAQQNAKHNNIAIQFIEQDMLKSNVVLNTEKNIQFDIIVSNPPYVRELEKVEIKKNVLTYEPHTALFVKDNKPLLFYEAIANFAKANLKKNGTLYVEVNQYLGKETHKLLQVKGFTQTKLSKDLFGNDRMIKASF